MPDILKIMQQAQQMQGRLQQLQDDLTNRTVTGASGGGMVQADADGKGQIKRIKIEPQLLNPADVEMLEDLVTVAVNEAQKKAAELAASEMGKMTGGLDLPFKMPF